MVSAKWSSNALEDIGELDEVVRDRILAKVSWFEENYHRITPDHLHYNLRELYKLRVGDYRIFYSTHSSYIVIEAVRHRRDSYK